MKVHIVCYEDVHGWILGKFALKLQEHLCPLGVAASISKQPDPQADINHHIIYYDYDGRKTTTDTVMVTHIDTDWKRERLGQQLVNAAMGICMSAETVDNLTATGLPREKLCFVNPGHDGEMRARRTIIGITSKVQPSGCKREGILLDLAQRISPDEFQFRIMGAGWDEHVKKLRLAGFSVDHWNAFDRAEYLKLMPTLDYYLYLGMDEGSMGYMDALAAGVQTIVTTQGYHLDAPGGITHGWSQPDELLRIFEGISREKRLRQQAVAKWTWPEYAKRHFALWTYLLAPKSGQDIPASLRGTLNKMAVRPTGVTFTENAMGLTAAAATHHPSADAVSVPPASHRPRVMLMADVPNWIFARHCNVLMERLRSQFDFDLKLQGQTYNEADYDLIYPLEWNLIPQNQIHTPAKYVTSIRSHTSWAGQDFFGFTQFLNTHFQRIHTVSERLTRVFKPFVPQTDYVTHGTDTTFFTPTRPVDQTPSGRVRVGWAGNRVNKTKGFEELIAPLGNLPGVELVFCGYMDKNLDLEGMRRFYDSIDVYICSSAQEGNNNSLLEAAAMERTILTTNNGTVPEYLEHGISALIVERELPLLIQAVCELRDDPELRRSLGLQARQSVIAQFDWKQMAPRYAEFFIQALKSIPTWQPKTEATQSSVQLRAPRSAKNHTHPPTSASSTCTAPVEQDPLTQAESMARQALALNPKGADALLLLAHVLYKQQRWLDCAKTCQELLAVQAQNTDGMVILGECLVKLNEPQAAIEVYQNARHLAPNDPDIQARLQDLETKHSVLVALTPEQNEAIGLGLQALENDDTATALDHYRRAQSLGPAHPDLNIIVEELEVRLASSITPASPALSLADEIELLTPSPVVMPVAQGNRRQREPGWSFLIITNGKRPRKLVHEIESIRALNIPQHEILVGGEPPTELPEGIETVLAIDAARNGRLGEMRNALTAAARYDHLVVVDDDFLFHSDFYTGLQRYGDNWDALSVRILNPDGSRFWDWATHGGPRGHVLLDYTDDDDRVYITGGLILLKAEVADRVKWDDERGFYQGEDLDFSSRLRKAGIRPSFNCHSTTTHDDGRYTMAVYPAGRQMRQRPTELGIPVRWSAPIFNPSGYASEAINFVLPLENRCTLGIHHKTTVYSESFTRGLASGDREALFRMSDRFKGMSGGIVVSHNPAGGFIRLPDADYSIGRSMFETDRIAPDWVAACNRMDEVWVPSQFNVETFAASGVERSKLVVIPGAVDSEFFDPARHTVYPLPNKARFNFLSIFEWSSRKGWDVLLAAYLREFSADDDVCLWLRTYLFSKPDGDPTEAIWQRIRSFTASLGLEGKNLPRIELIAEQVPSDQLPCLYLACDCYVAPSRGEGWGRPQHEAMLMERPVIATNWSANTEFMTPDNSYLLDYEVVDTQGLEPELSHYKGHRWANPSETHLRTLMRHVFTHPEEARIKGQAARKHMARHYTIYNYCFWFNQLRAR